MFTIYQVMQSLPPELTQMIKTGNIELLDKYCRTSKRVRVEECPKLYAEILWKHYRLRAKLDVMEPHFQGDASSRARVQVLRIRATYFAERSRLQKLSRAIQGIGSADDVHAVLRLMQFHDPARDMFNINYFVASPVEDWDDDDTDTLLDTLLFRVAEGLRPDWLRSTMTWPALLTHVEYLIELGAKASDKYADDYWMSTMGMFITAFEEAFKEGGLDAQMEQATIRVIKLLIWAGAKVFNYEALQALTKMPLSQAFWKTILVNTDEKHLNTFLGLQIMHGDAFHWRLFDFEFLCQLLEHTGLTSSKTTPAALSRHLVIF